MKIASFALNLMMIVFVGLLFCKWQQLERAAINHRAATYDEAGTFQWLDSQSSIVVLEDVPLPKRKP